MPDFSPILHSPNLILRLMQPDDQQQVFEALSDERVVKYYGVEYHSYEATQAQMNWYAQNLAENTGLCFAITYPNKPGLVGACAVYDYQAPHRKAELGYWLLPDYCGKGIMREALKVMLPYAFNYFNLHRLEAQIEIPNNTSRKLLEYFNFRHEGTLIDCEMKRGAFISLDIFALLRPALTFTAG